MIRPAFLTTAVALIVLSAPALGAAATSPAAATQAGQVTPADAAPFIGDWTLTLQGPNGPATFDLSVKEEKEKVVGEISSAQQPKQAIASISKVDKNLVLNYSFLYEGNPVETVVTLSPAAEGKTMAQIDFAGGAYVMTGTAAKREKDK